MNTIKINGGGPLVGKTFYAVADGPLDGTNILELDSPPFQGESALFFVFSCTTGYMIMNGFEIDLLRVDASDLAKLGGAQGPSDRLWF